MFTATDRDLPPLQRTHSVGGATAATHTSPAQWSSLSASSRSQTSEEVVTNINKIIINLLRINVAIFTTSSRLIFNK